MWLIWLALLWIFPMPDTATCGGEEMSTVDRCGYSRNGYRTGSASHYETVLAGDRFGHGATMALVALVLTTIVWAVLYNRIATARQRNEVSTRK